jgi:hypothetical protein
MLLYFDIFQYPLNSSELRLAIPNPSKQDDIVGELLELGLIEKKSEWYFLRGRNYTKRISEQSKSDVVLKKAKTYSKIINCFPFVRGVYISGSLSKDWSDDTTDVDYFVVTSPQRLWLCRTMLILFKKIFLFNSRKYFCLNYFIDTENLRIEERNIFTATEICFLKPMINEKLFYEFLQNNKWIENYYISNAHLENTYIYEHKDPWYKKLGEKLLSGKLGESLDIWSMKRTLRFWRNKFPGMQKADFDINFKSSRTISKHHPNGFQKKVLDSLELRVKEFEKSTSISLS